jgi:tetratricopeptide (TPR) repeat protein
MLNPLSELLVDQECDHYKPGFESLEEFRKRHKLQIEKVLEENSQLFKEGLTLLFESELWTPEEKQTLQKLIESQKEKFSSFELNKDSFPTIGAVLGFDEHFYNKGLQIAEKALDEQKVDQAKKIFIALSQINPLAFQFLQGLGFALLDEGNETEALVAFLYALQVADEKEAPKIALLVANTLILLGYIKEAKETAQGIVEVIGSSEGYEKELEMAKELLTIS